MILMVNFNLENKTKKTMPRPLVVGRHNNNYNRQKERKKTTPDIKLYGFKIIDLYKCADNKYLVHNRSLP